MHSHQRAIRTLLLILLCGILSTSSLDFVDASPTAVLTVNDTGDAPDATPGDGVCATATGGCTLRAAIMEANAGGPDSIGFSIPGTGPHLISVERGELPAITTSMTIDGAIQPGYSGKPVVTLDGALLAGRRPGLVITGGGSTVRGLHFSHFGGEAISIKGAGNNTIVGNHFSDIATELCKPPNSLFATNENPSPIDLRNLGHPDMQAHDINNCGQVVGYAVKYEPQAADLKHAFLWLPSPAYGLGVGLNDIHDDIGIGYSWSVATAINDRGQVTGYFCCDSSDAQTRSFLWEAGQVTVLPLPVGFTDMRARDINERGQIVGWATCGVECGTFAFLWENDSVVLLNGLGVCTDGYPNDEAWGINNDGQIIGASSRPSAADCTRSQAVLWENGAASDLSQGSNSVRALAINDGGEVLLEPGATAPGEIWIYTGDEILVHTIDLHPNDMNNNGMILGRSDIDLAIQLWDGIDFFNVGDGEPAALNDWGQVIGTAVFQGAYRELLWPAPSGLGTAESAVPSAIGIVDSSDNRIGGETAAERNIIAGSSGHGIRVVGDSSHNNQIQGNQIGLQADGTPGPGVVFSGVYLSNASGALIAENQIVGSDQHGVHIEGAQAISNTVQGNHIGISLDGTTALANQNGIRIHGAPDNSVLENVIAGNTQHGIWVSGNGTGNTLKGNRIGTNSAGNAVIPNGGDGIRIDGAPETTIGGSTANERNVISGNAGNGIHILASGAVSTTVTGNFIGVNAAGNTALGNSLDGILIANAPGAVIGGAAGLAANGPCQGMCNLIAGNVGDGIKVMSQGGLELHTQILGNFIGTNGAGVASVPNRNGIWIDNAGGNWIGWEESGQSVANLIAGNIQHGILLSQTGSANNWVFGNRIGVNSQGDLLGNGFDGVRISNAAKNLIGNSSFGNTIAGNGNNGVSVVGNTAVDNRLRGNRIYANAKMGIDLGDNSVTPNDLGNGISGPDGDSGPNQQLNFPVAVLAEVDGPDTIVTGIVNVRDPISTVVDIYAVQQADANGFGEGDRFLGSTVPEPSGRFLLTIPGQQVALVSATVTDSGGDGSTSEFSPICRDTDGDALCDQWETTGIDYDGNGTIDLDLSRWGVEPTSKDILVEVDYMVHLTHTHRLDVNARWDVEDAFQNAPVSNPSGVDGVYLTIVEDEFLIERPAIYFATRQPGPDDDFYDIKTGSNDPASPGTPCGLSYFDGHFGTPADRTSANCMAILGARGLAFRYAVMGHDVLCVGDPTCPDYSGQGDLPGDDFIVTFGGWLPADVNRISQSGTFMHELGHTLNLTHGGTDDIHNKPNYLSIMNYSFQLGDIITRPLDYSRWALAPLTESNLLETKGIDNEAPPADLATWPDTVHSYYDAATDSCIWAVAATVGDFDWNQTGGVEAAPVQMGINNPQNDVVSSPAGLEPCQISNGEVLNSAADWPKLLFNPRRGADFSDPGLGSPGRAAQSVAELSQTLALAQASLIDVDEDGRSNAEDNCPFAANPDQADSNGDGIGDACSLAAISISPGELIGEIAGTVAVTLALPAPTDTVIALYSSHPQVLPVSRTVPIRAGALTHAFPITPTAVTASSEVTITAYLHDWIHAASAVVTVRPVSLAILVDASKDGGAWWTPQSVNTGFDPQQPHQGKALADYLRGLGHSVTELTPGEIVTAEMMDGQDMVISPGAFAAYTADELAAYSAFVNNGGKLLLLAIFVRPGEEQQLGKHFGVTFAGFTRGENRMATFAEHPITQDVAPFAFGVGSGIIQMPDAGIPLGWLSQNTYLDLNNDSQQNPDEPTAPLGMAALPVGQGRILFSGATLFWLGVPQPLLGNSFVWLTRKIDTDTPATRNLFLPTVQR